MFQLMLDQEYDLNNLNNVTYTIDGRMLLQTDESYLNGSFWYSNFSLYCFDASKYTHLSFDISAPSGSSFNVEIWTMDADCSKKQTSYKMLDIRNCELHFCLFFFYNIYNSFFTLRKDVSVDGNNHTAYIPLADFQGQDLSNFAGVVLSYFAPGNIDFYFDNFKLKNMCMSCINSINDF